MTPIKTWNIILTTSRFSVGALQIVTGIYLGYAVFTIKKCVSSEGSALNVVMLGMHAATFGLYMISILVYYVFYVNFYLFDYDESSKIEYFDAWIVCVICSFIA